MTVTNEEIMDTWKSVLYLQYKDTERGLMNKNFEPANHLLSAEEFKNCWENLAWLYSLHIAEKGCSSEELVVGWQPFLALAKHVVRKDLGKSEVYDMDLDECASVIIIDKFLEYPGISEETWIKFFDSLPEC